MKFIKLKRIITVWLYGLIVWINGEALASPTIQIIDKITMEEAEILKLTNGKRHKRKLKPLKINRQLVCMARKQSANMARQRQLSHTINGKNLSYRVGKAGYLFRHLGENIARSKKEPYHVVRMWMKSHGHRVNLLNPNFREIGIGIAIAPNGDKYFTQIYGTPR